MSATILFLNDKPDDPTKRLKLAGVRRYAAAAGQQAVTVQFYPLNGVTGLIQFYSRENGMSGYAPYLSVEPRDWHPKGLTMVVR